MKFKYMKPIKIDKLRVNDINRNKGSLLYSHSRGWFIIVKDVKFDNKLITKTKFWSREKVTSKRYYITSATIVVWATRISKWITINEEGVKDFFDVQLYENLTSLRKNYLNDIKAPLKLLGATFDNKNVNE